MSEIEEDVALPCLERRDALGPRPGRSRPVEGPEGDARAGQVLLDQLQMLDELREHQDLVAACEQLVQGLGEGGELGARRRPRILHQAGVAAREA